MSRFKRVLSFILTMVMLVGMIPPLGISVSAAAYDTVPSVYRRYEEGEQGQDGLTIDRELKRLAVLKLDLNGGVYYHTDVTHTEDRVSKDNLLIEDGFSGTINIRIYHSQYGRDNDCKTGRPSHTAYGDYIGMPYINGVCMANDDLDLCDLLVTLFYSIYNVDEDNAGNITVSQLEAFNFNSGAATNQAYVYPSTFTDGDLSPNVLFGNNDDVDSWNMPCVWGHPDEFEGKSVTLYAGPEGNGKSVSVELYDNSRDDIDYLLPINEKVIKELYGFYPENGSSDQRVFIGWAESYDESSHQGIGEMYDKGNINYRGNSDSLYAIWGYPIMFDADGGTFKDADGMLYENGADEYLSYVADYAEWKGEDTDPAAMYRYNMPDWNGYTVEKPGARRVGNGAGPNGEGYAYGLINADGTFFTWEGYGENLTIPPTGGAYYPDTGNANGATWDMFRCTDIDDKNNPYGIRFPEFLAIWEPSVTYYPNGGTGEMPVDWLEWDYTKPYSYKDYVIRGCIYTKENAHFTGWNTSPDGTGYSYAPEDVINKLSSSDPIKLYAQWSDNSYEPEGDWTVTLDPYGGAIGSVAGSNGTLSNGMLVCPAELDQTYGDIIGTLPTPTRDGYYFDGWWYEQDDVYYDAPGHIHEFEHNGQMVYKYGKGWFLDLDAKFVAPQNVTFHAKWVQITNVKNDGSGSYNMYYDPDGYLMEDGDVNENVRVTGGKMITEDTFKINKGETYKSAFGGVNAVPMAVKRGYTLAGWIYMPYWFVLSIGESYGLTYDGTFEALWAKIEHEHEWINISVTPATCKAEGSALQGCVCGETRTVTTAIKPHSYTIPWGVAEQATCTTNRIDIYLCDICKVETTEKEAPDTALGHDWGPWYYPAEEDMPTCEGTGLQVRDCQREDCFVIDQQVTDPIGHDYVGTVIPAFCDCEEVTLYICQNDPSHQYTEATGGEGALGHIFGNPYDLGNGYTRTECIRESDGVNPDCPHYVDTPNRYNIIYDLVLPTATYGANTPYWHTYDTETVLVDPTAANATFAGWYLDREYTQPITAIGAQDIKAPIKIYAKWTLAIKLDGVAGAAHLYDADGVSLGAGVDATLTMVYGEDLVIPYRWWHNTHSFTGWTNASIETLGQLDTIPGTAFTANATLTATYAANVFPVIYIDGVTGEIYDENSTSILNASLLTKSFTFVNDTNKYNPVEPTRDGYTATLHKLSDMSDAAVGSFNRNTITITNYPEGKIVYYVKWTLTTPAGFKVILDDNGGIMTNPAGGTIATATVTNHVYNADSDLTGLIGGISRNGYTFKGWSTSATYGSGTVYFTGIDKIPANTIAATATLYAVWEPNTFIVEYQVDGVTLNDETAAVMKITNWATIKTKVSHTYGTNTTGLTAAPVREGYTVSPNYWTFKDGTRLATTSYNRINAAKTYWGDGTGICELREDGNWYIVLSATTTPNTFKVILDDNGGTMTNPAGGTIGTATVTNHAYNVDSDLTGLIGGISRNGYTFKGWSTSATYGAGTVYFTGIDKIPANTVPVADTLYAVWEPNTFIVEYQVDGVVLNDETAEAMKITNWATIKTKVSHTYGTNTTGLTAAPVRAGYTVSPNYWTFKDGTRLATTSYNRINAAKTYWGDGTGICELREDGNWYIVLSATTTPNTFKVILDDNGGIMTNPAGGTIATATVTNHAYNADSDLTGLIGNITRKGYNFKGWSTSADYGAGTVYFTGIDKIPANTVPVADTLYAVWEPETYDIVYHVDGKRLTKELADEMGIINYDAIVAKDVHTYNVLTENLVRVQRTGYTSTANWSYDPSGTPVISGHDIAKTYCNYDDNGEDFVINVYSVTTPDDVRVVFRTPDGTSVGAANLNAYFGIDNAWPMVDYDQTYVLPTETLRAGYHLAGLYSDTACTNRIYEVNPADFYTKYNQGTTYTDYNVYVKWEVEETTVPTGSIDLGVGATGVSTEFIKVDDIRYGIYAQSYPNVTIIGDKDTTNYVPPKVEYFLVENGAMTWDEVANVSEDRWIEAENGVPFSLEGTPDGEYIMYVRLTDDQGNVNFISSQRFVIDNVAPDFVELEGGEYCFNEDLESALAGGYTFTVVEKYPDKITINDDVQTFVQLQLENDYTLPGSEGGADYTVYAKDKAGNETTVTVKIYNCHDWCDWYVENAEDCLNDGNDRRDCQRCGEVETQVRPALGHEWGETTYTWSEDGKTCTATRVCSRSTTEFCTETVDANVTSEITIPATCVAKGTTTYTATFNVDWAQTQTIKKVDIEIAPDNHQLITHEAKAPTCTEIGWDAYVTCEREGCDHSTYVVKFAIGHDWNEGEITTYPTCVEKGEKLYTCNNDNSHTCTKEIEATGHTAGETVIENNVSSTCTTEGSYDEVVCCGVCGEELSRETVVVDKLGHTPGEKTIENEVEPTCTVDGSHDEVVYCKVCGEDVSRTKVTDEALGHDWKVKTEYEWIADEDGKYIKCIATRVCARNCKEEGYTEISVDETITSAKVDSSCTVPGTITYTADFVEEGTDLTWTSTQTKVVNLELLDHIYDYIVEEVITEATCTTEGDRYDHYYCSVCKQNYETKEVKIPELGHKFYDGEKSEENPHGWYVYTPATFTQDGLERRDCLRHAQCGHYETRVISAKEDTSAPVISITDGIKNVSGDPSTEIFYKNDVAIILTATDPESGIDRATYTVTKNGVVIAENDTIDVVEGVANGFYTLSENAEYVITVNATNTDGDDSTLGTYTIIVDKVVPTVEPEATESFDEIKVKVEDKYLDKVVVIANGEEVEYTPDENGYITIPDSDSETTYYTIVATDKAGNETKVSVTVKFDGEEPVPSITTDLENVNHNDGEADYTNDSDVVIIITAEDNEGGSGVDHIDYVITDENGNVVEKGVYDENNKPELTEEGKYTVTATATDKQGNKTKTPVSIDVIIVDHNAPVITDTTNDDRSTTVNVKDNFALNEVTVNNEKVTVDEDGNYIIPANNTKEDKVYDIVATDKAGNVTDTVVITVPGDKTGPSITAKDDENKDLNDEEVDYDDDGAVEITIEANDTESGVNEITYVIYDENNNKIGEGTYDSENKPVINVVDENGNLVDGKYTVEVTVTDNAGNKTEETLDTIIVDVTVPEILLPENNCTDENTYCVPENNTITINIIENNVERIVVKVNGEINDQYIGKTLNLTGSDTGTTYEITVTDMVGNITETTVVIYGTHAWNNGEVTTEPTCLDTGIMTYTCTRCGETKTEVIPATGHDWGKATYSWLDDGKSCTATRVCNNDISHVETASAAVTAEQTKAPTCAVMGETTYTATFEETWAEAQTTTRVDVAIDPTNHDGHLVQVAAKTPTCTEIGWNAYEYCTECDYTTYEEIPATDHNWDDVTYTWSEDGKSCTAKRVCKNDETHVETATAVVTSEVTTPATCVDKGTTTYTASFTVEWAQPQTTTRDDVTEDSDNHVALEQVEAKAPTCTEIGWNAYEKCDKCGYTTYVELPANGHPQKHGFKEVIVKEMTDNKDGTYSDGLYYVIEYCKVCNHVFSETEYTLHPVAQNVESGKLYTTVNEALEDAEAGNTVKILENILDEEHVLASTEGYLDLNGWTLETYHISTGKLTHIIDSSEGNKGHLIVNASKQTINPSNCDLPVYEAYELNGETRYGYRFYDSIILQQLDPKFVTDSQTGATSVSLTFRPIIEDSGTTIDLLGDGGNDEKLKIGVVFTVTDANGVKSEKMHWICQDSLVEVVYQNTRAFMVTLTGLENYETITLGSVIMSDLGVEMTTYEKDGKIISTVNTYDISTGKTVEA